MKHTFILFTLMLSFVTAGAFVSPVWREITARNLPVNGERKIFPTEYRVYQLDEHYMRNALLAASDRAESGTMISLPAPSGREYIFRAWHNNTMSPELAAQFPEIRTLTAICMDNPEVTARLTVTPKGLRALIRDTEGSYLIDPYSTDNNGYYIVYSKKAVASTYTGMACGTQDDLQKGMMILNNEPPRVSFKSNGTAKKTFRLALSCTGEYAVAVNGPNPTLPNVLAAMTNTINRVNGILERELAVTLQLVSNNSQLVYLDPATDPFTSLQNSNINANTQQANQTNVDNVIGTANYDMGHIFCSGTGGIADFEGLCDNAFKARAATGSANPVGDAFDVDYVVHEIGHQLGAEHTFNYNSGACSPHARIGAAYEPGSGSTIMAYAGLCSGNNIQDHSDDYFHAKSLDQITEYIANTDQMTCGTTTPISNNPPAVPSVLASYDIPCHTPFELEAPQATDTDNDYIKYCWELYDLGDFGKSIATTQYGPTIRSFAPTTSRWRIFPRLDSIKVGTNSYPAEKMPDVTRDLNLRLTVRDFFNGTGAYDWSDTTVTLHAHIEAGPFKVNQPNLRTDYWKAGNSYTVKWDVANSDQSPVNCANVDIYLSTDDGATWPYTLAAGTPNDGNEIITVPAIANTGSARVKIKGTGNVFFDMSDNPFFIADWPDNVHDIPNDNAVEIYPNPARGIVNIRVIDGGSYAAIITNSIGQQLWQGDIDGSSSISTSAFPAGIYHLVLYDKGSQLKLVKKLVIE